MKQSNSAVGYLPEERPGFVKLLLYAIQQVIVMFPATVTVALVTGFQVSTTIFASGLATCALSSSPGGRSPCTTAPALPISRPSPACALPRALRR